VEIENGDKVTSGTTLAKIITDNQVVEITLNEVDIAKVKTGQQATLVFDALDSLTMTGKVSQVGTIGSVNSGVVQYDITIALDSTNSQVKPGMSASATIITDIAQDVLTVPSMAIKTATDGTYYVLVPSETVSETTGQGVISQKTVVIGLDDGTNVEIKSGLNEGDKIVVSSSKTTVTKSTTSSSSSSKNNGGFFMMGGGGPR